MALQFATRWAEKRSHLRLSMQARVGVTPLRHILSRFSFRPSFFALSRNASLEGLELTVDREVAVGSPLLLWIQVEDDSRTATLKLRADVRWARPGEMAGHQVIGIRFHDRPRRSLRLWKKVMTEEVQQADANFRLMARGGGPISRR